MKFKEMKAKQGFLHFAFTLNLQEEGFHVDFKAQEKKTDTVEESASK